MCQGPGGLKKERFSLCQTPLPFMAALAPPVFLFRYSLILSLRIPSGALRVSSLTLALPILENATTLPLSLDL